MLLPEWRSEEAVLERFAREARVLMRLTSPHVGKLLDVGNLDVEQGDLPFLVLEYLDGKDLDDVLAELGRVPFRRGLRLVRRRVRRRRGGARSRRRSSRPQALERLSGAGARHAPVVKVLDFGIAAGEPSAQRPVGLTGMGYVDRLAGVYVSGADARLERRGCAERHLVDGRLLYELIAGRLPFAGESDLQLFSAAMTRPPRPLRAHMKDDTPPAPIEEILITCLRKQREDRYPSMRVLSEMLRAASAAPSVAGRRVAP